jgi:hypothetical protein
MMNDNNTTQNILVVAISQVAKTRKQDDSASYPACFSSLVAGV